MNNILKAFAIVLGVLCMSNTSCDKDRAEGVKTGRFDTLIELSVDEKVIVSGNTKDVLLTLNSLSDSRCAKDVQCVWAGNAVAEIQLTAADGSTSKLNLCIGQCDKMLKNSDTVSVTLNNANYTVILNDVKSEGINKAVLRVKKS